MIFAPHTLQVKVFTPMETDEFGRPIPGTRRGKLAGRVQVPV